MGGIEALRRLAAESKLDEYKNRFTHAQLRDMSDGDFEAWKIEMRRLWGDVVDAERAYYRATADQEEN
jgi:hypothetical protein